MNSQMCGDDSTSGSVVLHLSSSRKTVASALRRACSRGQISQSLLQRVGPSGTQGLGDVLLLHRHDDGSGAEAAASAGWRRGEGLGTFLGVFVPCTCTIFGVVVFLRLGFVVGQAGVWCSLLIVLASFGLCVLTTISLCSLIGDADGDPQQNTSGNGEAATRLDPGVYIALRRGVGPELGAALGWAFYFAFVVDAAFYITGVRCSRMRRTPLLQI